MADRLPSDHPSIETVRARVERHGGGIRLAVPGSVLPEDGAVPRVVLDERTRFGRLASGTGDNQWVVGLYDTTKGVTDPTVGQDRLEPWLSAHGRGVGTSVEVDVIEADRQYGIREPGTRTVYQDVKPRSRSLDAIARGLEDRPGE